MTPTQAPAAKEGLLPCPFCKSVDIDPKGWLAGDGSFGPQCMTCGATAESKEKWNTRPRLPPIARTLTDAKFVLTSSPIKTKDC